MSSTPTPGPWKITGKTGDGKRIFVESNMERDNWECLRCEVDSDDCDSDMAMANARLIAASPDLLAACKDGVGGWNNLPTLLRAAADEFENDNALGVDPIYADMLRIKADAIATALSKAEGGA